MDELINEHRAAVKKLETMRKARKVLDWLRGDDYAQRVAV